MTVTLASLSQQTGLAVLDHLEQSVRIPVVDGLQAQGDLIVIPLAMLAPSVRTWSDSPWTDVPPEGRRTAPRRLPAATRTRSSPIRAPAAGRLT